MRVALLVLLALVLAGCPSPPLAPTKRDLVADLQSDTVALVRIGLEISIGENAIKIDPVTKVFCSGVWVSHTAFLTAHHCVDEYPIGEELAYVVKSDIDPDKKLFPVKIARLAAVDEKHDLALLIALSPPAHSFATVSVEGISAGDAVSTMGHPFGLWYSYSSGEVSAVRKAYMSAGYDDPIAPDTLWVQTFAPISPGNSGGGLFDSHGHLIGICSRSRRDGQGLNFYIHRDHIAAFLKAQAVR